MIYYTKTNEWIALEGKTARIGLTKAAQEHLGDVTFVELPTLGTLVNKDEILATIESVKAVIELYAPVSGKVTAVQEALKDNPERLTQAEESEAWVLEMELIHSLELDELLDQKGYEDFLAQK